jgi:starch synthase (maltosyl-transferring)
MKDFLLLPRLVIENVSPLVDAGRYALKRTVGDAVEVGADIFKDGHDLISARVVVKGPGDSNFAAYPLEHDYASDRWTGRFTVDRVGRWEMAVEAWPDVFRTWRSALEKRIEAGQDVRPELLEGAALVRKRMGAAASTDRGPLENAARVLEDTEADLDARLRVAFSKTLLELMYGALDPRDATRTVFYPIVVDRVEANFAAWYELFPRSQGTDPNRHGTFRDTERRIPEIAALGFDVIYLPPIHPIGFSHRKGRNNTRVCEPGDVGSPWAIGSQAGGHDAVHPELGTLEDFRRLVKTAREFGIETALDFALQCSPDHPWIKQHPEWFYIRPDGSIRYAENPPKKYEDIYPLNFWNEDAEGLWTACRDLLLFWIEQGVTTFRVDNPHTKPLAFWEWCIAEVKQRHPEVIFLSESFTRPKRMNGLAKLGFTQSYTYFTWKNSKWELTDYLTELTRPPVSDFYRPNFFANTPDILHEYLQKGGRAAFRARLVLAATLAPVYGIYSGFELCEHLAVREGSEEYLNSEKYEIRVRDWNAPGNIKQDVARINRIRRENRALQLLTNLEFVTTENDDILAYLKSARGSAGRPDNHLLVVVNVNPHQVRETMVHVPLSRVGIGSDENYDAHDLLTGTTYTWRGSPNYVRLDPQQKVAHVFRLERRG